MFFPISTADGRVKRAIGNLQKASKTVADNSPSYLSSLHSLHGLQVGKYQFYYVNPATQQKETIDSHFFSEEQVHQALQLGQELSKY